MNGKKGTLVSSRMDPVLKDFLVRYAVNIGVSLSALIESICRGFSNGQDIQGTHPAMTTYDIISLKEMRLAEGADLDDPVVRFELLRLWMMKGYRLIFGKGSLRGKETS